MKYRNRITVCAQGEKHQSKLEAGRCDELHLLQKAGEISNLRAHPQVTYRLEVNGMPIARYVTDFVYAQQEPHSGRVEIIVEDTKSRATMTPTYRIKKKLMKAIHGIDITEVFADGRR